MNDHTNLTVANILKLVHDSDPELFRIVLSEKADMMFERLSPASMLKARAHASGPDDEAYTDFESSVTEAIAFFAMSTECNLIDKDTIIQQFGAAMDRVIAMAESDADPTPRRLASWYRSYKQLYTEILAEALFPKPNASHPA